MTTNEPDQKPQYFFRGLPLNEELIGMLNDLIADFYDEENQLF